MNRFFFTALLPLIILVGCSSRVDHPIEFEPNWVHAMKYQIKDDVPTEEAARDTFWIVDQMFGTPEHPKLPNIVTSDDDLSSILSMEHLQRASGPANEAGRGLFRKHCVICHGVTGNGRGPTAPVQIPYPRDYRMGVFKFKSTPRGSKPTKEDLTKVIAQGIGGTAMGKIPELTDQDVAALVDYVIYLAWRGEVERGILDSAMFEGDLEDGGRIIDSQLGQQLANDPNLATTCNALADRDDLSEGEAEQLEAYELYQEKWEYAEEAVTEVAEAWLDAEEDVIEVEGPPEDLPVAKNADEVQTLSQGPDREVFLASVARGGELFRGKIASCSKCHGEKGLGDGQTTDYDDWTKDWTTRVGLKPDDRPSLVPLLARGAMEPRNIVPRNFAEGVFRGGSSSEELYLRITQGIDGTPMPAATFVDGQFEENDVWHLINFIRSMQTTAPSLTPPQG